MVSFYYRILFFVSWIFFVIHPTGFSDTPDMDEVFVNGVHDRMETGSSITDMIIKTDIINMCQIEQSNAANLSEAIHNSTGVRVNNECAMCGIKRILLNGLRGEQTTLLVDGLPAHTLISGFYAVDAIPMTGIERIEVARGAGASLTAPEAIGGVINIVTREATKNSAEIDMSSGENGYKKLGLFATGKTDDGRTRATLVSQYDVRNQFDADNNGVSESPFLNNTSYMARISQDVTQVDNIILRYAHIASEIFGGPVLGKTFADGTVNSPSQVIERFHRGDDSTSPYHLFEQGDVRKHYTGKAWETTEWIKTERDELSVSWLRDISDYWHTALSGSYAKHKQDSFYEGFDYYAIDDMYFFDARANWAINPQHILSFGVDYRNERLDSDSYTGSQHIHYVKDSFTYRVTGLYLQDNWQVGDRIELSLALRLDNIRADFIDTQKAGIDLSETIVSPRLNACMHHNALWISRFSAGRGYRAPLSFFESDHGILDGEMGFDIDINALERSKSFTYTLSFANSFLQVTTALAYTAVDNLTTLSETSENIPLLTQIDQTATVLAGDMAVNYRLMPNMNISLVLERYVYNQAFKSAYSVAPAESRITLDVDWDIDGWDIFASVIWYGSRNLHAYNYEGFDQVDASDQVIDASRKTERAPDYYLINAKVSKSITACFTGYIGVNNLFGYTQAGNEDTPLMYNAEGAYDVSYIYGPLRGREIYAGLKWVF